MPRINCNFPVRERLVDAFDVHRLRTKMDLSRARFGLFLGVSDQTIMRWESGVHPIPQIVHYALAYLMHEKPQPEYWLIRRAGSVDVVEKWETEAALVEQIHFDLKRNIYLFRELEPPARAAQGESLPGLGPLEPGQTHPFKV